MSNKTHRRERCRARGQTTPSGWRCAAILVSGLTFIACGGQSVVTTTTPKTAIRWSQTAAPEGVDVPGAEWLKIVGAGGDSANVQVAAVVRPQGPGPFPLVVWLHGGEGFHVGDVTIAAQLSAAGFMVLAGCWQNTPAGTTLYEGVSYQNIPCLQLGAATSDAVSALITVGEQLPGARKGAIGVFGISRGGTEAISVMQERIDVSVVVVDSPACPCTSKPLTHTIHILFLGGTADESVPVQWQQDAEQALRAEGYSVDDHYYPGSGHGVTYFESVHEDAMRRTIDFFRLHLG